MFEATEEYAQIEGYLAKLRHVKQDTGEEPSRVITVRMPGSLHTSLKTEAHRREISLNDLCINRLLFGFRPAKSAATDSD